MDTWNHQSYQKISTHIQFLFEGLLELIEIEEVVESVLDLGCGPGDLTLLAHQKLKSRETLGIDLSANMLQKAAEYSSKHLNFEQHDITTYEPIHKFQIVISSAALQWVDQHEVLIPKILSWVQDGGQVAFNIPYRIDHPSRKLMLDLANEIFPNYSEKSARKKTVLEPDRYAEILIQNGFLKYSSQLETIDFEFSSTQTILDWMRGTIYTHYQSFLLENEFHQLVTTFEKKFFETYGDGDCVFPFTRLSVWGRKQIF